MSKHYSGEAQELDKRSSELDGPFRKYEPANIYWIKRVGRLDVVDIALGLSIAVGFSAYVISYHSDLQRQGLTDRETELYDAIGYYKQNKFYLGPLPPFGFLLYSFFSYEVQDMRMISLYFASATLSLFYWVLRRTNTSRILALFGVFSIAYLPLFRSEASSVTLETLQWLFFAMSFLFWQNVKCSKNLSRSWICHLAGLGISLGLAMSTKFIGLFTWIWIITLVLINFWNVMGDVNMTTCQLACYAVYKFFFLGLIPFAIFTSCYVYELNSWRNDSPEFSSYMSREFKTFLRGPHDYPKHLYYGSVITLRHLDSLGGYLHSHNFTYKGGSQEQQVTLIQLEYDHENEWIIEHSNPALNIGPRFRIVHDMAKIKLRHRSTGLLLRASSAKPPVTEQEYDLEVSCTGGYDYVGDSDETWLINAINGAVRDPIEPLNAILRFTNEGHKCQMIAHDIRLPDWGFNQQEVLCLEHATMNRALFQIDQVKPDPSRSTECTTYFGETKELFKYFKLIVELLKKQYKYNYYEKNYKQEGPIKPETWPVYISRDRYVDSIWCSSLISLLVFGIFEIIQAWRYNPWKDSSNNQESMNRKIYQDFGITCSIGWFLHFYPLLKSPHDNVEIVQYMPSLFMGLLSVFQTFTMSYHLHPLIFLCICCYIIFVIYY
ncbi:hypothetical protein HG535_0A04080 [Zygotorulaspora mrakii]|uniref:dolichyl-phosphate-mannose--protein mannosyltransferase n=1 Tax=Zygotorulaspora mrakii TaxID=42260 RepID=A0A7H9AVS6_ZYGMR|nr:uncharacterized protein HG535_0A04080 [Zygotorulaspora mrakii]QLG70468.1 hypothetical protein HG535_0A04080 [Zygotorulaspora mrakii]